MKHYFLTALLATASLSVYAAETQPSNSPTSAPPTQTAQPVSKPKPFGLEDITPEQEKRINDIQTALQTQLQAQRPDPKVMEGKMSQLRALIEAENFDENKVKQIIQEQSDKQLDTQVIKIKAEHDMYQVLTPEQKETLKKRREEKKKQMKMMMEKAKEQSNKK